MKASCLQENFNKALQIAGRIISTKAQLPILSNILLETEEKGIKVAATNLETGISLWVGAKVEKKGKITIPARPLGEMVASLPAGKLEIEAEGEILRIACGSSRASFNGLSAGEFPSLGITRGKDVFFLPTEGFLQAISQVSFAAATDEGRPVLTGVKMTVGGGGLVLAATDGYRLSVKNLPFENKGVEKELVIPARALLEASHAAQEVEKKEGGDGFEIFLSEDGNQVGFSFGRAEITTRLIEGDFPDFSKIIPQSFTTRAVLEKESLLKAVKIASIFARDSANIVKWEVGVEGLSLSANSPQVGENRTEIEAKVEGEPTEIAFNFRFLLDFLNAVKTEEIVFETSGALNPGVFKPAGDDSFLHIIMPVRVQG